MGALDNKVAIVTASTRGIGYACVEKLAKEGALVYMACRNLEFAKGRIQPLLDQGLRVKSVFFEAYENESIVKMVDEVLSNESRIDILVNNFGGTLPINDLNITKADHKTFIDYVNVHLSTVFLGCQQVIQKAMIPQESGSIINIGSVAGIVPDTSQLAYGTSKAAIIHMSKQIAVDVARNNIRCNVVCPGMTSTDAVNLFLSDEFKEFFLKHTPIRRMSKPEEIADAVAYFATAEHTTGQVLAVNGGFGIPTPVYGDQQESGNVR